MSDLPKYPTIDAHLHVVDFLQESDGLKALLERMDEAKVEKAVIFGVPVTKEWSEWEPEGPNYYLSDNARCYYYALTDTLVAERYLALSKMERARFIPLLCGFNPVDKYAVKHVQRTLKLYPGVFRGIGELLLRHDDLTNLLYGQPPRADHPALETVYKLAGERGCRCCFIKTSRASGAIPRSTKTNSHTRSSVFPRRPSCGRTVGFPGASSCPSMGGTWKASWSVSTTSMWTTRGWFSTRSSVPTDSRMTCGWG